MKLVAEHVAHRRRTSRVRARSSLLRSTYDSRSSRSVRLSRAAPPGGARERPHQRATVRRRIDSYSAASSPRPAPASPRMPKKALHRATGTPAFRRVRSHWQRCAVRRETGRDQGSASSTFFPPCGQFRPLATRHALAKARHSASGRRRRPAGAPVRGRAARGASAPRRRARPCSLPDAKAQALDTRLAAAGRGRRRGSARSRKLAAGSRRSNASRSAARRPRSARDRMSRDVGADDLAPARAKQSTGSS